MLVLDQLQKDDPHLRFLAVVVGGGLLILLAGLWWVQVVSVDYYQEKLETQSMRTVRIPAVRGSILDREGRPLAENRPSYNVDLYLEDLNRSFKTAEDAAVKRARRELSSRAAEEAKRLGRKLTPAELKTFALSEKAAGEIRRQARFEVSNQIVGNLGSRLGQPIALNERNFQRRYEEARALPIPILSHLNPTNVARFEEQSMHTPGLDLDVQSMRVYPNGSLAFHLLGYVTRNTSDSAAGELADYSYRLDDYSGRSGLESIYDEDLRGVAGVKSVLVNHQGFRQSENVWAPAEPGANIVLTLDLEIQKAAEKALAEIQANVRGAVVVMDVQNGDVLTLASAPTFDANFIIQHTNNAAAEREWQRFGDTNLLTQFNRAVALSFEPGSIFKIIVGMAALETGAVDPRAKFHSQGSFPMPGLKHPIGDTAGAGDFDFERAMAKSSNPYFITQGLKPGVLPKMLALGRQLHLGESTGLLPGRRETTGNLPTMTEISGPNWRQAMTAYVSIGQGPVDVTPMQMAVMIGAVANGGKVFWPRLLMRVEPNGPSALPRQIPEARLRDTLEVSERTLEIVRKGMLADVETEEGTGHGVRIPGFHIAGKTGTAEVELRGSKDKGQKPTWFVSFGPFEKPRYAVVVFVQGGASGGRTCVPVAKKIYEALLARDQRKAAHSATLAQMP